MKGAISTEEIEDAELLRLAYEQPDIGELDLSGSGLCDRTPNFRRGL